MLARTHELVGVGFGLVAATQLNRFGLDQTIVNQSLLVAGSVLGALAPDIDCKESTMGRILFFLSWPVFLLSKFFIFLYETFHLKLFQMIGKLLGHRGIMHTGIVWIPALILAFLYYPNLVILGITIGGLSHLVADSFNPSGVMWLFPFTMKRFHIAKISTGSREEELFRTVVLVIDALILFVLLKGVI